MPDNAANIPLLPGLGPTAAIAVLGKRLRVQRLGRNLAQVRAAARAGITVATLQRIESGSNVGFEAVVALAMALGFDADLRTLFTPRASLTATIDDLVQPPRARKRAGRRGASR